MVQRKPGGDSVSALWLIALIPAWMLQYLIVVPAVWVWRYFIVPAFKIGGVGVLLLFIPVIGWIVLAVMILRRPAQPRSNAYLTPWGATLLGGAR